MATAGPSKIVDSERDAYSIGSTPPIDVDDTDDQYEAQGRSECVEKIKQRSQTRSSESGSPCKQKLATRKPSPKAGAHRLTTGRIPSGSSSTQLCKAWESDAGAESAAPSEASSDDDDETEFEVEKIVDHRLEKQTKEGKVYQYLIKWKGFDKSENSWEPARNLNAGMVVKKYWEDVDAKKLLAKLKKGAAEKRKTAMVKQKGGRSKAISNLPKRARPSSGEAANNMALPMASERTRKISVRAKKDDSPSSSDDDEEKQSSLPSPKRKKARSRECAPYKSDRHLSLSSSSPSPPRGKAARACKSDTCKIKQRKPPSDEDSDDEEGDDSVSSDEGVGDDGDSDHKPRHPSQKSKSASSSRKSTKRSSLNIKILRRSRSHYDDELEVDEHLLADRVQQKRNTYLEMESWEKMLKDVIAVDRINDNTEAKKVHLQFKNGDDIWVAAKDAYRRAPQHMLRYYDERITYR